MMTPLLVTIGTIIALALALAIFLSLLFLIRIRAIDKALDCLLTEQRKLPAFLIQKNAILGSTRLQKLILLHQKVASDHNQSPLLSAIRTPQKPEHPPSEERIEETARHLLRSSRARAWYLAYTIHSSAAPLLRSCSAGIQLTEVLHRLQSRAIDPARKDEPPRISAVADPALRWCGISQECSIIDHSEQITFHLWVGYAGEVPLPSAEHEKLSSIVSTLQREMRDLAALESLSSKASEESASRRKKEQFFSHIAHDLRSPLGNIRSILHSFANGTTTEELLRFGEMNCDRIEQLTADIIVLSKQQAGALQSHPHPFILTDLMRGIRSRYTPMASQKKLELIVDDSQPLPPVWADPSHITRVIENLVGNAIKHSWSGTITIAASPSTSGCIRCSVRDSGPGIPTDKLDLITKPFQQLQDSISDGVGLGLAIAKLLTEANKGTFSVISEVGKGSEFSIDLPVWDGGDFRGGGGERTD